MKFIFYEILLIDASHHLYGITCCRRIRVTRRHYLEDAPVQPNAETVLFILRAVYSFNCNQAVTMYLIGSKITKSTLM